MGVREAGPRAPGGSAGLAVGPMRIVFWNIRAGGGVRVGRIASELERWAPDAVALCEFRATPPSLRARAYAGRARPPSPVHDRPAREADRESCVPRHPLAAHADSPVLRCDEAARLMLVAAIEAPEPDHPGRHARPESRDGTEGRVLRGDALAARPLAARPGGPRRRHQFWPSRHRRGDCGVRPEGRRLAVGARALGMARRVPPSTRPVARLHLVLPNGRNGFPARSGVHQRRRRGLVCGTSGTTGAGASGRARASRAITPRCWSIFTAR